MPKAAYPATYPGVHTDIEDDEYYNGSTNLCAIVALLTALLGLGLPAFVFGIIAMKQVGQRNDEDGWGMAFAATIIGIVELSVGSYLAYRFLVALD